VLPSFRNNLGISHLVNCFNIYYASLEIVYFDTFFFRSPFASPGPIIKIAPAFQRDEITPS